MFLRTYLVLTISFLLSGCLSATQPIKFQETKLITESSYSKSYQGNGTVLLDINWGRWWGCGGYQNAQLIGLVFDKLPMPSLDNEASPALVILSPSRLMVDPVFINHAYSLEPGEYALSSFSIKVAKSITDIGFITANRNHLYKNGHPIGGTFTVNPDETVFIGNFYLDCTYSPTLWRYHSDGKEAFEKQVSEYRASFPYLDFSNVQFRLFETEHFGNEYELPQ